MSLRKAACEIQEKNLNGKKITIDSALESNLQDQEFSVLELPSFIHDDIIIEY